MTWQELKEAIEKMPIKEQKEPAVFLEPYDNDPSVYCVSLVRASETFRVDGVIFGFGDVYLQ